MCYDHWHMVPARLKLDVMKNYRVGQCDDKRPTLDWIKAARAAINYVLKLEKKI